MRRSRYLLIAGVTAVGLASAGTAGFWPGRKQVAFHREVRPILNGKCITCHGGRADGRAAFPLMELSLA
jgi:hypothetical protein